MIEKKDINIDYSFDIYEDFKPINYEAWIIFIIKDSWWAERVFGFLKCYENPYVGFKDLSYKEKMEKEIVWRPCIIEWGGQLSSVKESDSIYLDMILGRKPTQEDAEKIKDNLKNKVESYQNLCVGGEFDKETKSKLE